MTSKIPYGRQDIDQADIDAVVEVLRSDFLTQGPQVPRFEAMVAAYCDAAHGVATNSATSALHVACMALDVGPGDRVWTSPTTFVASANCALYCGAKVDFVDIDPETCNLSVTRLAEKLAEAKPLGQLPKVVIPVHLCGQCCDMAAIRALADEYGFRVIEDASHAIGARYRGEPVGNCRYSDITVFSFHPVKIITTAEGGMALTNDPILHDRLQRHRSHGITSDRTHMQPRPDDEIWNYQQVYLGYNYRMTDLQAALGASQMSRLDAFVARRREIAARYDAAFDGLPIIIPRQHEDSLSSYHLYPVRIRESLCGRTQRQFYDALWQANIAVNLHYIPVYRQPYYEAMGFRAGYCPEAERYHRETVSLPVFPGLSAEQQDYVINVVRVALGL
jgi:UDP-4-amino-4,6-dideoxy-N-acetyl-beta-L-altrosamine transaminase